MRVLLVEDDYLQAEGLLQELARHFPIEPVVIRSESEFVQGFQGIARKPPDIIILDVLLRWADLTIDMAPPPPRVRDEGYYRAGIRCLELISSDPRTASVPVILYTFVEYEKLRCDIEDLPPSIVHLGKGSNPHSLALLIRSLMRGQNNLPEGPRTIFIVHGHDSGAKEEVARFIERLGLSPTILHEKASSGRTIIEKVEEHSRVSFAVVLLTPDDIGKANKPDSPMRPRARQNVIFELGFFVARLGRERVAVLYKDDIELPSDYQGVLYIQMDQGGAWRAQLARELKSGGLPIDMNLVL